MTLTQKLAYSQIKTNRSRSVWTLIGIALSTAMITAVFGFAASGHFLMMEAASGNEFYINMYNRTLLGLGTFLSSIIVIASVIVVSNVFRISAGERTSQFGILKSAGATKNQIAQTIIYEGIYLCVIGIPAGLILGLLVNYTGIQIVNYFLEPLTRNNTEPFIAPFVISWQALIMAVVVSFFTVWISAWLPARKAARITAIDAVRSAGEIKVNAKHIRTNWIIKKLFKFEGQLASKSLKRNKRNFRATVVSLAVSITLFIIVGSFGIQMKAATGLFYPGIDATVIGGVTNWVIISNEDGNLEKTIPFPISSVLGNEMTEKMREYPNTAVFGIGADHYSYTTTLQSDMLTPKMREAQSPPGDISERNEFNLSVALVAVDDESYIMLCERAGVPAGSNILINLYTWYHSGGREVIIPFVFDNQTIHLIDYYDGTAFDLILHGEISGQDIPGEVRNSINASLAIIVPETDMIFYDWFASPSDKSGFIEYAKEIQREYLPYEDDGLSIIMFDVEAEQESMQSFSRLVMVFVYGFVAMLTLIGLTNVISTISTNVRSRSREFAVLRSVGMTDSGLHRMLNLESILCSAKSIFWGVPLGLAGSYLVYITLKLPTENTFKIPWISVLQCVIAVFVITWGVMRYSASRLRCKNIVEVIRKETV